MSNPAKTQKSEASKTSSVSESLEAPKTSKKPDLGALLRPLALIAVVIIFIALIAISAGKSSTASDVWDERTVVGNLDAKNHYIMYTDIMCPYCDVFSREIKEHHEEFESEYLEGKDIAFEVRMTDFLYEYGSANENSRNGAEAIYCATEEDKFWEYYYAALDALWKDYHSKGIGSSKTAPGITDMDRDYWEKVAKKVDGLGDSWKDCYENHKTLEKVEKNTVTAAKAVDGGVPYFKFNKFTTGGFDTNWGWDYVKQYLDAGLSN